MELPQIPQEEFIEPTESRTLRVSGSDISRITKALKSPTRQRILSILRDTPLDVSRIAERLKQTEANVSAQVQLLQKASLVSCRYEAGAHGVRKICEVVVDKIIITLE